MPLVLTDEQLYWHQDRREQAEEQGVNAVKKLKQEHAVTSEESWQVSGYVLFNDACREWMSETIEEFPLKKGKIYRDNGEIHGADFTNKEKPGRCFVPTCNVDHRHDDTPFWVWEEPIKGATYSIAVDVSEGIGEDYSVIFVNKIGGPHRPDEQVAVFRDNHTYPKDLAFYANVIGKWYNYGEMAVEYNTYQTTGDDLLYVYHYPNIYRWKHKDKINPMSQTWHWWTKPNTKAYLHQTAVDWLLSHCWIIRSKNFFEETTTYRKEEYASRSFGAASNCNDDELMCLPEGVMVTTSAGLKPIEELREGDFVLTHKGRFMPVTRAGYRYEPKTLYRVHAYGRPPLLLTGNHPMFLWEKYRQTTAKLDLPITEKKIRTRSENETGLLEPISEPAVAFGGQSRPRHQ